MTSCDSEPKPVVVTHQLIRQVDTTFLRQYKDSINAEMDSLCAKNYEDLYNNIRDSLVRVEIQKIEELVE